MKENIKEIFEKFSKDIEQVSLNNSKYYYFCGEDSEDDYNYKILLRNQRILLFKDIKTMIDFLRKEENIFDLKNTMNFLTHLRNYDQKRIHEWLKKNYSIIDIDFLQNEISKNTIKYDNIMLHSVVFDYISMLKDYFWQINDIKNYKILDSRLIEDYYDLCLDGLIFSKSLNKTMNKYLSQILNLEKFRKFVFNSKKYFDIL